MLASVPTTIPAENRDFPEWHHGRGNLHRLDPALREQSRPRTNSKPPGSISTAICWNPTSASRTSPCSCAAFWWTRPTTKTISRQAQLQSQIQAFEDADIQPFEIEIGGLNSFASAPFLEVHDPQGGIARLREILANGAREFRTAPYRPHLTVGLYAGAFGSQEVARKMAQFPNNPIRWK